MDGIQRRRGAGAPVQRPWRGLRGGSRRELCLQATAVPAGMPWPRLSRLPGTPSAARRRGWGPTSMRVPRVLCSVGGARSRGGCTRPGATGDLSDVAQLRVHRLLVGRGEALRACRRPWKGRRRQRGPRGLRWQMLGGSIDPLDLWISAAGLEADTEAGSVGVTEDAQIWSMDAVGGAPAPAGVLGCGHELGTTGNKLLCTRRP